MKAQAPSAWIMPGTALAFSLLFAFLSRLYPRVYGDALPAFTRGFLALYPLWLAIGTAALAVTLFAEQVPLFVRWRTAWLGLDIGLAVISALIVAVGLIALALPLLALPIPD